MVKMFNETAPMSCLTFRVSIMDLAGACLGWNGLGRNCSNGPRVKDLRIDEDLFIIGLILFMMRRMLTSVSLRG